MIPVVAIDGPSGSGKGTISRRVARALDFHLLDSGALYRATALAAGERAVHAQDTQNLAEVARELAIRFDWTNAGDEQIWLTGQDVTVQLRAETTGELASIVAAIPEVRDALFDLQRGFMAPPGLVADGRDMGTIVFPQAGLKVFLTASAEERAARRHKQLKDKGIGVSLSALFREIAARDERDANRPVAPLVPAPDALVIDSTELGIDDVVNQVLGLADERFDLRFSID